jgi:hypothetical protein
MKSKTGQPATWLHIIKIWCELLWLANTANSQTYTNLGIAVPPPAHLSRHINRVTWILGLVLIIGLTVVGQGAWEWQTALAIGAVFASNGYNRRQFGLRGKETAWGAALLLISVGLAGALELPLPGAGPALVILLIHWLWNLARPLY